MSFGSADNLSRRGVPQLVPTGDQKGKAPILLNRPVYQIGARESCRIRLVSSTVSQVHALLVQTRHLTYIRDLGSRTGLLVNGEKAREAALQDGDRIKIGRFEFIYRGPKKDAGEETPALPATLEVTGSPIPVPIEERVVLIGRRKIADIPLLEESVSNAHAVIFQWEGKRFIRDLGSRTNTYLNGKKIHEKELSPNDVIKVGDSTIRYLPSTQISSVDVVESPTDSQFALAPSAEEVDVDLSTPLNQAAKQKSAPLPLADTIGDIDITDDPSHHDTAVIPLSFIKPNLSDSMSGDHGLELIPDKTPADEPMPRTWREASTNDLPPIHIEEAPPSPPVTLESVAREEATDLGLTSHLEELSPSGIASDSLQLAPQDAAPQEGNATIDLSNVDFNTTTTTHSSEVELPPDQGEIPLIAHEDLIEDVAPSLDDTLSATEAPLAADAPASVDAPISAETIEENAAVEVIESTEPTPESALNVPEAPADETLIVSEPDSLSDTTFSRQVSEFAEPTTGEIVEPTAAPEPVAEVSVEEALIEEAPVVETPVVEVPIVEPPAPQPSILDLHLPVLPRLDARVDEPAPEPVEIPVAEIAADPPAAIEEPLPLDEPSLDDLAAIAPEEPQAVTTEAVAAIDVAPLNVSPEISEPQLAEQEINLVSVDEPVVEETTVEIPAVAEAITERPQIEPPHAEPVLDLGEIETVAPTETLSSEVVVEPITPDIPAEPAIELQAFEPEPAVEPNLADISPEPLADIPVDEPLISLASTEGEIHITAPQPEPMAELPQEVLEVAPVVEEIAPPHHAQIDPTTDLPSLDDLALEALASADTPIVEEPTAPVIEQVVAAETPIEELAIEAIASNDAPIVEDLASSPETLAVDEIAAESVPEAIAIVPAEEVSPEPESIAEVLAEPSPIVEPQGSLDDLALEALASADTPIVEDLSSSPAEPVLAEALAVNLVEEPVVAAPAEAIPTEIVEQPAIHEGNATLAPSPETLEEFATVAPPPELQDHDLISPPIVPLQPVLEDIDLGLEPLPTLPADEAAPMVPEVPQSDAPAAPMSLGDLASPDVAADPFDTPSAAIPIPPRPLKKRRDRGKQTVIRNFGKDASAEESTVSPFAGAKPGEAPIEFKAAEGSVDVFGAAAPADADQLLAGIEDKLVPPDESEKQNRRKARAIAPRPVTTIPEAPVRRPSVTYGDMALAAADAEAKRKKLLRLIFPVLLLGLILSGAAAFGAWRLIPITYDIQASVRFENLGASDLKTQNIFRETQMNMLRNEATRRAAILKLRDQFPQVDEGFLGTADTYLKSVSQAAWSNQQQGVLQLSYTGTDRTDDTARMLAVALAVHNANLDLVQRSHDAARNLQRTQDDIKETEEKISNFNIMLERDQLAIDRYQSDKLSAATTQTQNLDKEYQDAFAALKGAQAELDRLKKSTPANPTTQPAAGGVPSDGELAALTKKSEELAAKLTQARNERAELAKQARESLDAAYAQFQKQIESSQGAMQQSPELAKFVETAQSQMKIVREMVDDFIGSQQKDYQELSELKAKLDESMKNRRAELWAKDEQLLELAGQREITIRKINAAKSDNLDKEVESLTTELSLIESSIKGRQDVLSTDPMYAEVINPLQQLIEKKQKDLVENRKKSDDKLASLQKQFAASLPTVEKLPQEQQALASDMKQRLSQIDSARRQYAAAADQASIENDAVIKSMAQQLVSLQGDIEIRKQQMLAAQNGVAVKQLAEQITAKEKEVAELTVTKDKAEKAFFASQALVREMQTARTEAEAAMNNRFETQQNKKIAEENLAQKQADLKLRKQQVETAITPIEPTLADVQVLREVDRRWMYTPIAGGGVLVLTLIIVLWLAFAAAHANPYSHHTAETEENEEEPHENQPAVV